MQPDALCTVALHLIECVVFKHLDACKRGGAANAASMENSRPSQALKTCMQHADWIGKHLFCSRIGSRPFLCVGFICSYVASGQVWIVDFEVGHLWYGECSMAQRANLENWTWHVTRMFPGVF